MRVASDAEKVRRFFRITTLESASAFGRKEIYLEKRLESPRHVEIQAIADRHRKVVSLGERECSIQRRYQKLVEEAPSIALGTDQRDKLNHATVKGLTVAGYTNAGTVEFLIEKTGRFYFLEVNKRLQVEHLVSELTTRIDLVEEQLKVVSNDTLELSQNEIRVNGWAINCRINAEDPRANFVPSPGTVIRYHPPAGPGVRIDSALFSGCSVPEYYDSLIAKLATWGVTRSDAIQRMKIALDEMEIIGVPTTVPLHRELMHDEAFVRGNFDTTYLNHFLPRLNESIGQYEKFAAVVAAAGKAKAPSTRNGKEATKPSRWRSTAKSELMVGSNGSGW